MIKTLSKTKIKDMAKKHNVSISEMMDGYVGLGFLIDKYMNEDSQLIIKNSKTGKYVVIPVDEFLGKQRD